MHTNATSTCCSGEKFGHGVENGLKRQAALYNIAAVLPWHGLNDFGVRHLGAVLASPRPVQPQILCDAIHPTV
jgi:hypothetical protein